MSNILILLFGSGGLVGIIGIILSILGYHREERRAREATKYAQLAHRREVCTELLTSMRQLASMLGDQRRKHDHLLQRWPQFGLGVKRQMRSISKMLSKVGSEFALDLEAEKVYHAAIEYLQAAQEYGQILTQPMLTVIGKSNPNRIVQLAQAADAKMANLEAAARAYLSSPEHISVSPSTNKRARATLFAHLRGIKLLHINTKKKMQRTSNNEQIP